MTETLRYLQENEWAAIHEFASKLKADFEEQVVRADLFGSEARGNFGPDSDLDIFVVLDDGGWDIKDQIRFMAVRLSLEYDVPLNTHILSRERWAEIVRYRATFWSEVQRDGIALIPDSTNT